MKREIGIYKLLSPSGKVYIGQSHFLERRRRSYTGTGYGARGSTGLEASIIKYGANSHLFSVLHILPKDVSQLIINEYEILYMQLYTDAGFILLNIREGGSRGKNSDETRRKISASNKGKCKHTEEFKQRMRDRPHIGIPHTQAAKDKMSKSRLGVKKTVPITKEHFEKLRQAKIGKPRSQETKEKLRLANLGKRKGSTQTPEQRAITSAAIKKWWEENRKNGKDKVISQSVSNGLKKYFKEKKLNNIKK